jgi:hypothetical protein
VFPLAKNGVQNRFDASHPTKDISLDPEHAVRGRFGGQEVASGFSETFAVEQAEVLGTSLVGTRSLSFGATSKRLADN